MGDAICRYLDWDSEFFGVRVARLRASRLDAATVQSALTWCKDNNIQCLYFLADSGDAATVKLAEDNGFRLVGIRTTLAVDATAIVAPDDGAVAVRAAVAEDVPHLRRIAGTSHGYTRFYRDGRFPPDQCDALYQTWIERSCAGFADAVLVAGETGSPIGYITCKDEGEAAGSIGLVAVQADHQGRHVGRVLVASALAWFRGRGIRHVSVVTQGSNVAAQRLYQGCGFATSAVELWYHRWFTPRPDKSVP